MFNHVVFSKHAKKKNDASVVRLSEVGLIGANIPGLRILSKPSITSTHTLSKYGAIYTNDSLLFLVNNTVTAAFPLRASLVTGMNFSQ